MKGAKARILVVEDDDALRQGLLDVLVFNGYAVRGVEDGGLGLEASLGSEYDLILLDAHPFLDEHLDNFSGDF